MIEVPEGVFEMGSEQGNADERPTHRVDISTFWIDELETTSGQYMQCVEAGMCAEPAGSAGCNGMIEARASHPINCIDWVQAQAYCAWADKRLPTEAEWEKAARGTAGRRFPWGDQLPNPQLLNYANNLQSTSEVGSYADGISFYGVHDMSGNVSEWTADFYASDYYSLSPASDPTGPEEGADRVARGGDWKIRFETSQTTTVRIRLGVSTVANTVGLRCARIEAPLE
jgi:formylglycine-generating enzyme required for sulfatase activity